MKHIGYSIFAVLILFFVFTCSDEGVTEINEGEVVFTAKQVGGCNSTFGLAKASPFDSCFAYSFDETLKIDFCVFGNCCPDSQRFITNYTLSADTIFVEVIDTAANECRCICNYTVRVELSGLQKDSYFFYCNYPTQDSTWLKYREFVHKLK